MRVLVLSALRADYRILESCRRDEATVACPVVSLTGDNDPVVRVDDAGGWANHTAGRFDLHVFAGKHFYLDDHWADVSLVVTKHLGAHDPARTG
jgi:pyochelin biosynthesis protein PchC